jgi:hypothetical protein
MPDSQWTTPLHHSTEGYENNHGDGSPPEPGMRVDADETSTTDVDAATGIRTEYRVVTYSDVVEAIDTTEEIYEMCDRCGGGHTHRVNGSSHFTADLQSHVPADHFGERTGLLLRVTLLGQEIRRTQITMIGNGLRLPPLVQWDRRSVDHVETRVNWYRALSQHPCVGARDGALVRSEDAWLMVAEAVSHAEEFVEASVRLDTLGPLIATTLRLKQPKITLTRDAGGPFLVLSDAAFGEREVGRMAIRISEAGVEGLAWKVAGPKSAELTATVFGSQRTKNFEQTEDGKANDLHVEFAEEVTVFTDPATGNAGPFQDVSGNGTRFINLANPTTEIDRGDKVKLKFRSKHAVFPKIVGWQWTKNGQKLGSPQVEEGAS